MKHKTLTGKEYRKLSMSIGKPCKVKESWGLLTVIGYGEYEPPRVEDITLYVQFKDTPAQWFTPDQVNLDVTMAEWAPYFNYNLRWEFK